MRDYAVFYSPLAVNDLDSIYYYILHDLKNGIAAAAQEARIRKEIQALNHLPLRYERIDWEPLHSMNVRKLPVDNFVVYYVVDEAAGEVAVLRIFYGGQNVKELVIGDFFPHNENGLS